MTAVLTHSPRVAQETKVAGPSLPMLAVFGMLASGAVVLGRAGVSGFAGGFLGLDVLLVLGGLGFGRLVMENHFSDVPGNLVAAYVRRLARILPLAMGALIVGCTVSHLLLSRVTSIAVASDAKWSAGLLADAHFWRHGSPATGAGSPLQIMWVLAAQEQVLLGFGLAYLLVWRVLPAAKRELACLVVTFAVVLTSGAWALAGSSASRPAAFYSPWSRAWEVGFGLLLALLLPRTAGRLRLPDTIAALMAGGAFAFLGIVVAHAHQGSTTPARAALPAVLLIAVICMAPGDTFAAPASWLAESGLDLVLWSAPAASAIEARWGHRPSAWVVLGVLTGAAVAVVGLRLVVDRMALRPLVARPTTAGRGLSELLTLITAGLALAFAVPTYLANDQTVRSEIVDSSAVAQDSAALSLPGLGQISTDVSDSLFLRTVPPNLVPSKELVSTDAPAPYGDGCLLKTADVKLHACYSGSSTGNRTVMLIGDERAAQWLPALDAAGTRAGWQVIFEAKAGCPVTALALWSDELGREYTECSTWRTSLQGAIKSFKPDMVVLAQSPRGLSLSQEGTNAGPPTSQQWGDATATYLAGLNVVSPKVVVLGDIPQQSSDPGECLSTASDPIACATPTVSATSPKFSSAEAVAARNNSDTYVPVQPWFCTLTMCPVVIGSTVTDFRADSLSASYSERLSHPLAVAVGMEKDPRNPSDALTSDQVTAAVKAAVSVDSPAPTIADQLPFAPKDVPDLADLGCESTGANTGIGGCTLGDLAGTKTVVLYGDEEARSWVPALDSAARLAGWRLMVFDRPNCSVPDITYRTDAGKQDAACLTWQARALSAINTLNPNLVVLASAFHGQRNTDGSLLDDKEWQEGFTRTLGYLTTPTKVVLGAVPRFKTNPINCLATGTPVSCSHSAKIATKTIFDTAAAVGSKAAGATYVDVRPWLCGAACSPVLDGTVAYASSDTLTATWSGRLSRVMMASVGLAR